MMGKHVDTLFLRRLSSLLHCMNIYLLTLAFSSPPFLCRMAHIYYRITQFHKLGYERQWGCCMCGKVGHTGFIRRIAWSC